MSCEDISAISLLSAFASACRFRSLATAAWQMVAGSLASPVRGQAFSFATSTSFGGAKGLKARSKASGMPSPQRALPLLGACCLL